MAKTSHHELDWLTQSPEMGEEVLASVSRVWDISGPFPAPHNAPSCPGCRSPAVIYRLARFFKKGNRNATTPYRCDVGFKCARCSLTWTFGVVIPREMFDLHGKRTYTRKDIRRYMELDA